MLPWVFRHAALGGAPGGLWAVAPPWVQVLSISEGDGRNGPVNEATRGGAAQVALRFQPARR